MAQKRKSIDVDEISAAAACVNGCGFFGNAATGGMCSKCYREHAAATADDTTAIVAENKKHVVSKTSGFAAAPPEKKAKITSAAVASPPDGGADDEAAADPSPPATAAGQEPGPPKPAANRCLACRRKVGLTGFRCCCGGTFCGSHRHAEAHFCSFDYKRAGREQIAKNNPVVVAAKIAKI